MKNLKPLLLIALALTVGACNTSKKQNTETTAQEQEAPKNLLYGIDADLYDIDRGEVLERQTMGQILDEYGVSARVVDLLDKSSKETFSLRNIRPGHRYTAFLKSDTLGNRTLKYLAYEENLTDYVTFGFHGGDSVSIHKDTKEVTFKRVKKSAVIESSLWGAIMEQDLPYALAAEMEDIYQWTVDFFGIQKGDNFTVIYDEKFIEDTIPAGIGRVWGAKFQQGDKEYYAIPFRQNDKIQYWEKDGGSLRKQMLKAPLKYTRISSRFTYRRRHPVYKVYRPHTGVDYAAPMGTPVHSVADGVVIAKGWAGGGGNTVKIKHPGKLMTGYLHLSRYAKGIAKGTRVSQGQLIGYVGSTGASTGPHLDFRIWKNGKPVDPLKMTSDPAEPISKANRQAFEYVRNSIVAELNGEIADSLRITQLDSVVMIDFTKKGNSDK